MRRTVITIVVIVVIALLLALLVLLFLPPGKIGEHTQEIILNRNSVGPQFRMISIR
jgi:hypothetical protein